MTEAADSAEFRRSIASRRRRPLEPWPTTTRRRVPRRAVLFSAFPGCYGARHVADPGDGGRLFAGYADGGTDPARGQQRVGAARFAHRHRDADARRRPAPDLELPGVYQQVRLACHEFDVLGFAFPGVPASRTSGTPASGLGRDQRHRARRRRLPRAPAARGRRIRGARARRLAPRRRRTHRRARARRRTAEVEALETERGTVVTDLRPDGGELVGWSIRMPARANADLGAGALLDLLRARNAEDVVAAFSGWVDPVNRVLAADRTGIVMSATVGTTPERPRGERRLPLDAGTTLPADDLAGRRPVPSPTSPWTRTNVPRTQRSISAGHTRRRIAPTASASCSTTCGRAPSRDSCPSGATRPAIRGALLAVLPSGALPSRAAAARDRLAAWDGRMDAASAAAGTFAAWRAALVRRVAAHPALRALHRPHGFGAVFDPWLGVTGQVAAALARLLEHPALRGDAPALVAAALDDAADAGSWGATHRLLPLHVFAEVPGAGDPGAGLDVPLSGDGDTVRCTGRPRATDRRGGIDRTVGMGSRRPREQPVVRAVRRGRRPRLPALRRPTGGLGGRAPRARPHRLDAPARRHPDRSIMTTTATARLATGAPGSLVHAADVPGLGRLEVSALDPIADLEMIHRWVTAPSARFWGLGDLTPEELRDLYTHVDGRRPTTRS